MIIDSGTAIDFALLRSAEVALSNGFEYFVIAINNAATMRQETYNGIKEILGRPSVINIIYCYNDKPLDVASKVYVASHVVRELRKRYNMDRGLNFWFLKN